MFYHETMKMINEDYEKRQNKKFKSSTKPDDQQVDLENPPLPDYHYFKKLYCPNCTKEHLERDCDKSGGRGDKWNCKQGIGNELHWVTETGNSAFLKGRAKRMNRFRMTDRNCTKLGSYSKEKSVYDVEITPERIVAE